MKTEIQETELYKEFIKALDIHDMRSDDNPFVVKCCEIAKRYSTLTAQIEAEAEGKENKMAIPQKSDFIVKENEFCPGWEYLDGDGEKDERCYDHRAYVKALEQYATQSKESHSDQPSVTEKPKELSDEEIETPCSNCGKIHAYSAGDCYRRNGFAT